MNEHYRKFKIYGTNYTIVYPTKFYIKQGCTTYDKEEALTSIKALREEIDRIILDIEELDKKDPLAKYPGNKYDPNFVHQEY
jgi:hypothetical protein